MTYVLESPGKDQQPEHRKRNPLIWIALFFAMTGVVAKWRGYTPHYHYVDPADDCAYSSSRWGC